jgi:lipoate-protein ligase A
MLLLDCTLGTPEENLALDEALLLELEANAESPDVLRIWEPQQVFVVVGSSSRVDDEVDVACCAADRVPILRRPSGGAAIVTGPGCLMYAVAYSTARHANLQAIDAAHEHVLGVLSATIGKQLGGIRRAGTSDLAYDGRKFSGNSIRSKRHGLLYHGTLLYDFRLELISRYLRPPPRQPDYRRQRPHGEFVTNLPMTRRQVVQAVCRAFCAETALETVPRERAAALVAEKYAKDDWNRRR